MKRTTLILAAFLALSFPARPAHAADGFLTSIEAAKAKAAEKQQIIFVDLFADWCGWCHRMKREVFPSEAFQNATKDMVLLRVDTEDGGEGTLLAREYGIRRLPTFLLLAPDGIVAGTLYGYSPAEKFTARLLDVYGKYETFVESVRSEKSFENDYPRRLALAEEFLVRRGVEQGQQRLRMLTTEKGVPEEVRDRAFVQLATSQFTEKKIDESEKTLETFFSVQTKGDALERGRLIMSQIYVEKGDLPKALAELRNFKAAFPASPHMEQVDLLLPQIEGAVSRAN